MRKRGLVFVISTMVAFYGLVMPVTCAEASEEVVIINQKEVEDTIKPVLKGVRNRTVYVQEKINWLKGITAVDNVDRKITKKVKVDCKKVNLKKPGKYTVTYSVTDKAGNKTVKKATIRVKRDKAPVIKGAKNQTIYVNNSISYKKGVKAIDDRDGNITKRIKINSSKVNRKKPGKYPVIYSVKDRSGNKTTKKIYIRVIASIEEKEYVAADEPQGKVDLKMPTRKEEKDVNGDVKPSGKHIGIW